MSSEVSRGPAQQEAQAPARLGTQPRPSLVVIATRLESDTGSGSRDLGVASASCQAVRAGRGVAARTHLHPSRLRGKNTGVGEGATWWPHEPVAPRRSQRPSEQARWALTPPPGDHPGWLQSGGAHDPPPPPERRSASAQGPGQHGKTWATGEHSSRRAAPHGSLCPQHRRWPRGQRPHCWSEKRHDRPVTALLPVALQPQPPALGLSDPFGPEDSTGASGCC